MAINDGCKNQLRINKDHWI